MLQQAANAIDSAAETLAACGCRLTALAGTTYRWIERASFEMEHCEQHADD
jgi:hypothetical protein